MRHARCGVVLANVDNVLAVEGLLKEPAFPQLYLHKRFLGWNVEGVVPNCYISFSFENASFEGVVADANVAVEVLDQHMNYPGADLIGNRLATLDTYLE